MNVLLACPGIFDEIGGGQRFYANLILNNPAIDFYCFGDAAPRAGFPQNAHFVQPTDVHRRQSGEFRLDGIRDGDPAEPLKRHPDELALLLDLAASVPAVVFDVVDIPDFLPLAVYLPECLKYFGITCDKVVLSMHGTLSMGIRDNWGEPGDLSSLIEHEELLYRYCDIRYGIGRQYIGDWQRSCGLPAQLLDISKIYDAVPAARRRTDRAPMRDTAPDLCFIGRQEKWKGPDLFLELCSRLPRDAFGEVRLYGPPVHLHGTDSMEELQRLARYRSLDIVNEVVDAGRIIERMRDDRMVVVLPSRRDTFNLVAIEALLSGCPTVVSTRCGVCDFLDTAYPGIPYVKIDPDDLLGSYDEILALLTNYDAARAALSEYLTTAKPRDYGETLSRIYASEKQSDPTARAAVAERFRGLSEWLRAGFLQRVERASAAGAVERCRAVMSTYGCDTVEPRVAGAEFSRAVDVIGIWQETVAGSGRDRWGAVDQALERLRGYVFGGGRANLYRLMAEWEWSRGNDLLYATYWLRVMRLAGAIPHDVLKGVQGILAANGFSEAANAAGMLDRNDDDEIYGYLSQRRRLFSAPPEGGLVSVVEINRPVQPKISVIVSVYNGAAKIDTFVAGLERFTKEEKSISEFIFVDSASADDTGRVLPERLELAATRGIGALYMRSHERETIQRAWNRGIAAARGEYLAFLGIDEANRPGSLAKMADFLDGRRDIDWVQGSALITEVNEAGSYLRDVMAYDRRFASQHDHYLECCYISYVGALYRKSIHARVGFYDDSFRAAGDTEFKNRALPFIRVETLPETLGTFLNYPEARTTQSPAAELEDLCAWHLHRTSAGVRYAFETRDPEDCIRQFRRALHYKKSYMERVCTDIDYAWSVAQYLKRYRPDAFTKIEHFVPNLLGLRLAYERLDNLANPEFCRAAKGLDIIGGTLEHVWFGIAQANAVHKLLGLPAQYEATNDNRWHQHHLLWPSTMRVTPAERHATAARGEAPPAGFEIASQPRGETPARVPLPAGDASFEIDLSRPLAGSGWYPPENLGGNWYRWTGPEPRFGLDVLLAPHRSYLCNMVLAPGQADVFDGFSVTINDVRVSHYDEKRPDGTIHLRFPVPSAVSESRADFCQIVFRHTSVYRPAEIGAGDTRHLGFAVRSIVFSVLADEGAPALVDDDRPDADAAGDEPVLGADDAATGLPTFDATIGVAEAEPEPVVQMSDAAVVRRLVSAAAANGGRTARRPPARVLASRPKSG